jgi:glutamyl-tRNA reductase
MRIAIVHRPGGSRVAHESTGSMDSAPTWRTCLREVSFLREPAAPAHPAELLRDDEAYRVLLEVLCGLRSPMAGETQVLGQFKTFLADAAVDHAWLLPLGQRLLADARAVRDRHLRGLGSRSYGSAVRRRVADCPRIAIIGAGALADEILPFVAEGRVVDQWTRRHPAADGAAAVASTFLIQDWQSAPIAQERTAIVVAAPVATSDVMRVASRYGDVACAVDLRAEPDAPLAIGAAIIFTLSQIFQDMESARASSSAPIEAARREIARRSLAFAAREQVRPFGWDDLCA